MQTTSLLMTELMLHTPRVNEQRSGEEGSVVGLCQSTVDNIHTV